jgi:hypothetical protein
MDVYDYLAPMGGDGVLIAIVGVVALIVITKSIFTEMRSGFSKKRENFVAAVGIHFAYYNFVKRHNTLRMTPAMAAGVAGSTWSVGDLVEGCGMNNIDDSRRSFTSCTVRKPRTVKAFTSMRRFRV